jgi:acetyl esterase/lipase
MKSKLVLKTIIILFSFGVNAQVKDTIYLWPNKVPNQIKIKQPPKKKMSIKWDALLLTEVTNPALVVFKPKKQNNSNTAIIICPGGGYSVLSINNEGYKIAKWFNSLGFTAFVLQYRVPKNQLGALNDIQRAIRIVRSNASNYQIDTHKIGVLGFSAGGSLSARAATNFTRETYDRIDTIDDYSSRPDFSMLIYPAYLDKGENRSLTPELKPTKNTPPFFIFGTADDKYGNSSLVMATALRDNKTPVDLHMLSKGGHGYGMRPGNIAAETWPILAKKWLEQAVNSK